MRKQSMSVAAARNAMPMLVLGLSVAMVGGDPESPGEPDDSRAEEVVGNQRESSDPEKLAKMMEADPGFLTRSRTMTEAEAKRAGVDELAR